MATDRAKELLATALRESRIPGYMHEALIRYIVEGCPSGSFLMAILTNDLKAACRRADEENQRVIWDYVNFLFNYAPMMCWGSDALVQQWIDLHKEQRKAAEDRKRLATIDMEMEMDLKDKEA
jgi:hypothetical protein